jgi:hypothetical protein
MNIFRTRVLARSSLFTLTAAALLATSSFGANAAAPAASEIQSRYEQERARCLAGQSGQAQETCLKEAGAARDAAKQGQLNDGGGKLGKNAKDRCDVLTGDDKRDCMSRVKGKSNTTESGSVKGGGIIRETVTTEPASAASAPR